MAGGIRARGSIRRFLLLLPLCLTQVSWIFDGWGRGPSFYAGVASSLKSRNDLERNERAGAGVPENRTPAALLRGINVVRGSWNWSKVRFPAKAGARKSSSKHGAHQKMAKAIRGASEWHARWMG